MDKSASLKYVLVNKYYTSDFIKPVIFEARLYHWKSTHPAEYTRP